MLQKAIINKLEIYIINTEIPTRVFHQGSDIMNYKTFMFLSPTMRNIHKMVWDVIRKTF